MLAARHAFFALVVVVCAAPLRSVAADGGPLVREAAYSFAASDGFASRCASDGVSLFAPTFPNNLVRFDLATTTRTASLALPVTDLYALAVNAGFAYVGTVSPFPPAILKVNTSGPMMRLAATLTLSGQAVAEGSAHAIIAATDRASLYAACVSTDGSPTIIAKIDAATFARPTIGPTQVQLGAGESNVVALAVNPSHLFACSLQDTNPRCARVHLASLTRDGGIVLVGVESVSGIVLDGAFMFVASLARILKVDTALPLGDMSVVATSALDAPDLIVNAMVVTLMPADASNIYVVLDEAPMRVVTLRRSDLLLVGPVGAADAGEDRVVLAGAFGLRGSVWALTSTSPPRVIKWSVNVTTTPEPPSRGADTSHEAAGVILVIACIVLAVVVTSSAFAFVKFRRRSAVLAEAGVVAADTIEFATRGAPGVAAAPVVEAYGPTIGGDDDVGVMSE